MSNPTFLVTNDDGIHVFFLRALVDALCEHGTVYVAAPKREQSWVGRGVSRHREVSVVPYEGFTNAQAWEVDGTPSDAVNIALGHLLPKKPDVVVSGINVGFNAMIPVLYSSGTVAGALEGASWGLSAVALSMHLLAHDFDKVKEDSVNLPDNIKTRVKLAARMGAKFSAGLVGESNDDCMVSNINFPANLKADSPWVATQPGKIKIDSFFEKTSSGNYRFRYMERTPYGKQSGLPIDYEVFSEGSISLSLLNFHNVSQEFRL
ncbi:MAG: 5'/3'-nucleotidase SurE [Verrucomicrobia bacterium]|nr:5'/3'-nucleotidase SurE [Verrucomicrobiota bacterium]